MKVRMKINTKGITLIALVITIVVLIILAVISINAIFGENGIISRGEIAKEKWNKSKIEEEKELDNIGDMMNSALGIEEPVEDQNPGEMSGEGTKNNPYLIESIEDLVSFSNNVNNEINYLGKIVVLKQTLNFNSDASYIDPNRVDFGDINKDGKTTGLKEELTTGNGFTPIGNVSEIEAGSDDFGINSKLIGKSFKGTFEGNGKAIKDIYISPTAEYNEGLGVGLFGWSEGNIENLVISGIIEDQKGLVCGGITGFGNGNISNCVNSVQIKSINISGGIVGGEMGILTIENCVNVGNVYANEESGGIIGATFNGQMTEEKIININNCINKAKIGGKISGGIVGESSNTNIRILECYNKGKIYQDENSTNATIGGIIGKLQAGLYEEIRINVMYCYNEGEISSKTSEYNDINIGGIVGYSYAWGSLNYINIEQCYNKGNIVNNYGESSGGIIGESDSFYGKITISDLYNTGNISGGRVIGGVVGNINVGDDGLCEALRNYNSGDLNCNESENVGGIVGNIKISCQSYRDTAGTSNIESNYNIGNIISDEGKMSQYIGGICGENSNSKGMSTISNCYNNGKIQADGTYRGSILGKNNSSGKNYIENCYYNNNSIGGINGNDVLNSATYLDNIPTLLEIVGEKFKEDLNNINNQNPILQWQ